jgi:uncharacterized membrane protein
MATTQPFTTGRSASILASLSASALAAGNNTFLVRDNETVANEAKNAQDMYGLGVRVGTYLQGFAFVLGLCKIQSANERAQFGGMVLGFQLLARWWQRRNAQPREISLPELWITLAQMLIIATPGVWLVFAGFLYRQRAEGEAAENARPPQRRPPMKKVIWGQGLNFLLLFAVNAWTLATLVAFTVMASKNPEDLQLLGEGEDRLWLFGYHIVNSKAAKR